MTITKKRMILACGLPGCGKSTEYEKHYRHRNYIQISADLIRRRFLESYRTGIYFDVNCEDKVWTQYWKTLRKHLQDSDYLYIDNTNLSRDQRKRHIDLAHQNGFKVTIVHFDMTLRVVMRQNVNRPTIGKRVSMPVMQEMVQKFEIPTENEADDFIKVSKI